MTLQELDRLRNLVIRSEIKPTDSIEEMVFKAYLKHENLKDTADEINNLQIKKDNNDFIKISKETVSEIIKDKNSEYIIKDKELYDFVDSKFKSNKKQAQKRCG